MIELKPITAVHPPETNFLFNYWGHMVPPFKPDHSLFLGYGEGVTPELMRKIWGQCKITAVDRVFHDTRELYREYSMQTIDAQEFVRDCTPKWNIKTRFDYIAVDLWENDEEGHYEGDQRACPFIYDQDFAFRLKEMTKKMLCLNIPAEDVPRTKPYYDAGFKFLRCVAIEGNMVLWWSVND